MIRASWVMIILVLSTGCGGGGPVKNKYAIDLNPSRASESKLSIAEVADEGTPAIGAPLRFKGWFTIGPKHQPQSIPTVKILSGRVQINEARAEQGDQGPDGRVPFEAELKCPDQPGKYTIQATMMLGIIKGPPPTEILSHDTKILFADPITITVQGAKR